MTPETIWGIVGTVLSAVFAILAPIIKMKANKYLKIIQMILDAFDDGELTQAEFAGIMNYIKTVIPRK